MHKFFVVSAAACAASIAFAGFPHSAIDTLFPEIGTVGDSGSGTVITDRHVLTAAHVPGTRFRWRDNGWQTTLDVNAISRVDHPTADLAILEFAPGTFASHIWPVFDDHFGEVVTMVGFGGTATRRADESGWNEAGSGGVRRAVKNVVDGWFSNTDAMFYDLDDETDPNNSHFSGGGAIAGEGGIYFGDSGGAWLVDNGGTWNIIGVNSFIFDATGNYSGNNNQLIDDGDGGGAVRLSLYENWIRTNAPVPEPATFVALGLGAAALIRRRRKSA